MRNSVEQSSCNLRLRTLLVAALVALMAQSAIASDTRGQEPAAASTHNGDSSSAAKEDKGAEYGSVSAPVHLSAIGFQPMSEIGRPRKWPSLDRPDKQASLRLSAGTYRSADASSKPSASATQGGGTARMSVGEKFNLFAKKSFLSPGAYALSAFSGVYGEWLDDDHHHHSRPEDFAADSATRAARSFAFRATANFFEKFAYASMFKQDPRYHRSGKKGAGRIGYAISRVFVTQSDRGGTQFNATFIAGGLTAAAISNAWERDERVNAVNSLTRWAMHVGTTAFTNIVREFIGGQ